MPNAKKKKKNYVHEKVSMRKVKKTSCDAL